MSLINSFRNSTDPSFAVMLSFRRELLVPPTWVVQWVYTRRFKDPVYIYKWKKPAVDQLALV